MKATLIFLTCLCALNISAQNSPTQVSRKGTIRTGFVIGAGFSNFTNSEAPHKTDVFPSGGYPEKQKYNTGLFKDARAGIEYGLSVEYFLRDDLSIKSGIQFSTKGIDIKSHINDNTNTETYRAERLIVFERNIKNNYVVVPVLLKKYITNIWYVQAGGYVAALTASKMESHNRYRKESWYGETYAGGSDSKWAQGFTDQDKEFTKNFDCGLSAGGGISVPLEGNLFFTADLLINFGLMRVDNKFNNEYKFDYVAGYYFVTNTNYYGLNSDAKNISATLTVGLAYSF